MLKKFINRISTKLVASFAITIAGLLVINVIAWTGFESAKSSVDSVINKNAERLELALRLQASTNASLAIVRSKDKSDVISSELSELKDNQIGPVLSKLSDQMGSDATVIIELTEKFESLYVKLNEVNKITDSGSNFPASKIMAAEGGVVAQKVTSSLKKLVESVKSLGPNENTSHKIDFRELRNIEQQLSVLSKKFTTLEKSVDSNAASPDRDALTKQMTDIANDSKKLDTKFSNALENLANAKQTNSSSTGNQELLLQIIDVQNSFDGIFTIMRSYLSSGSKKQLRKLKNGWKKLDKKLAAMQESLPDTVIESNRESLSLIQTKLPETKLLFDKMTKIRSGPRWDESAYILKSDIVPLIEQLSATLSTITVEEKNNMLTSSKRLTDEISMFEKFLISLTILVVITATALAVYICKLIISRLLVAKDYTQTISSGILNTHLSVTSSDEIGEVLSALNAMTDNLKNTITNIQVVADSLDNEALRLVDTASLLKSSSESSLRTVSTSVSLLG